MRWLSAVGLVVMSTAAVAQCSRDVGQRLAAAVRQRQSALLQVKVAEMSSEVPLTLQKKILDFKEALSAATDSGMGCATASEDAVAMQSRLAKLLHANQPEKPLKSSDGPPDESVAGVYGANLQVSVSAPASAPRMRVVVVGFGIECGGDSMLLVYEPEAAGWHRTLRWQSLPYAEISGAFGDFFEYAVLPGTPGKVVVAHGTPWCTSRFSGFKVDVLAPAESGTARVVWHTERGYSRGDYANRLRATEDGFELRVNAATLDVSSSFERTVIYRYRVAGEQVTRVGPIAINGRGFVEEWMAMPWDEAKGQTAPEALAGMRTIHERLERADKDAKTYVSYTYGPVRACSVKGRYEVEMDAQPGGREFYAIEEGAGGYRMVNCGTTQDERCSGPDVMKKR